MKVKTFPTRRHKRSIAQSNMAYSRLIYRRVMAYYIMEDGAVNMKTYLGSEVNRGSSVDSFNCSEFL